MPFVGHFTVPSCLGRGGDQWFRRRPSWWPHLGGGSAQAVGCRGSVCKCEWQHTHTYIYIYIYAVVLLCRGRNILQTLGLFSCLPFCSCACKRTYHCPRKVSRYIYSSQLSVWEHLRVGPESLWSPAACLLRGCTAHRTSWLCSSNAAANTRRCVQGSGAR